MKRITLNSRVIFHHPDLLVSGIFKELTEPESNASPYFDPIYIIWDNDPENKSVYGKSPVEIICTMSGSNWHLFNDEKEMLSYILKNV